MENKFQIISDGASDISMELAQKKNIDMVPFYVSMDGENYMKENVDIGIRTFYKEMVDHDGVYPKSSMPSTQDYYDVFEKYAKEKVPMLCICITTKFSGSMQSALNAKNMLLEEYPDAKLEIIDSQLNTVLEGIYVLEACRIRDMGMSLEESVERMKAIRESGRIFFTVGNIEYLKHGGRIGKLAGIAGGVLGIRPLITMKEGEIFPSGVSRSRKKSLLKVIDMLLAYLTERQASAEDYSICIGYGYDYEEAVDFQKLLVDKIKDKGFTDIPLYQIGATVGVHTGPYPLGIGIVKRVDKVQN